MILVSNYIVFVSIKNIYATVNFSNICGSQVPVIAMDRPLFVKAKLIQWA